jgi:uncharacterized SAM-binding protein YcdF (DUF218 family)/glycosyltransferase involved in cell wall biosynthesis
MLQGRNIVCISSIDWDFIWQGHQQIMSTLAAQGNRVLFIENTGVRPPTIKDLPRLKRRVINWWRGTKGFWRYQENLFVYSPLVLPFPYSRVARMINRIVIGRSLKSWMQAMEFSRPILWTFLPTPLSLDLIRVLDPKVTVYYCIDNLAESSFWAKRITASEAEILRRSDLVFVTSQDLYSYARRYNPRVEIFSFGVDLEHFEKVRALSEEAAIPEEMLPIPRPIAGYVGGIHRWLDQSLIVEVAGKLPQMSFVFVGPIQTDVSRLRRLANVYFLGERSHSEIPYYVRAFDVGLIPYVVSRYTDNVYPTKLNEYLAMGKPVVSTELKEIVGFNRLNGNLVHIGTNSTQFASGIEEAVTRDGEEHWFRRIAVAGQNSWQKRIERMSKLIEERLEIVEQSTEVGWEERLLAFYRGSRRRIAAAAGGLLFLYLLIFYTPIVWSLAEPLKLVDPPRLSDAIVVFAGGVGESGLAGEGYQERAKHAVDLYHSKHAPHIIFSSGYSYLLKEAESMKSLAVSLGVPVEAIVLEEKAANTYENVKFVKEILGRNGWRSILLVSSPYHMRRASLTFRKVAPHISVTHSPVSGSRFYNHALGASAPQIRAILQEYAGILYYWWKNRI